MFLLSTDYRLPLALQRSEMGYEYQLALLASISPFKDVFIIHAISYVKGKSFILFIGMRSIAAIIKTY